MNKDCDEFDMWCKNRLIKNDIYSAIFEGMTNGEVIRALFPNLYSYDGVDYVLLYLSGFCGGKIEKKWWDAPYKAESEVLNADSD